MKNTLEACLISKTISAASAKQIYFFMLVAEILPSADPISSQPWANTYLA
jgi:hypothetical protein